MAIDPRTEQSRRMEREAKWERPPGDPTASRHGRAVKPSDDVNYPTTVVRLARPTDFSAPLPLQAARATCSRTQ
jgi:hypothetical protein